MSFPLWSNKLSIIGHNPQCYTWKARKTTHYNNTIINHRLLYREKKMECKCVDCTKDNDVELFIYRFLSGNNRPNINMSSIITWECILDQLLFFSLVFNRTIEEFEFEKKHRIRKASLSILKWNVPHSVVDYYLDFKVNTKICYFVLLFSPNWPRSLATFYSINVYSMRRIVCLCALYCNRHRFKPDHKSQ